MTTSVNVHLVMCAKRELASLLNVSPASAEERLCARVWLRVLGLKKVGSGLTLMATVSGMVLINPPFEDFVNGLLDSCQTDGLWVKSIDGEWETKADNFRRADWQWCDDILVDYASLMVLDNLRRM